MAAFKTRQPSKGRKNISFRSGDTKTTSPPTDASRESESFKEAYALNAFFDSFVSLIPAEFYSPTTTDTSQESEKSPLGVKGLLAPQSQVSTRPVSRSQLLQKLGSKVRPQRPGRDWTADDPSRYPKKSRSQKGFTQKNVSKKHVGQQCLPEQPPANHAGTKKRRSGDSSVPDSSSVDEMGGGTELSDNTKSIKRSDCEGLEFSQLKLHESASELVGKKLAGKTKGTARRRLHSQISRLEKEKTVMDGLSPDEQEIVKQQRLASRALKKAQGLKLEADSISRLKKVQKRRQKQKKVSRETWKERITKQEEERGERAEQRKENIRKYRTVEGKAEVQAENHRKMNAAQDSVSKNKHQSKVNRTGGTRDGPK
eukprot:GHVQ01032740.1.p1 GENE.GHVQ01032740.1~~GHVQ01032740.1.p1  ORF type:complete len:370 (+),score=49.94 GHVQ01032740.1:146-1255(+)